ELGVEDRVEMVGTLDRDQLAEAMRCAGALLLTSWSETFGLVALEAQASGTPVLAWRAAGGVREAVAPDGLVQGSRGAAVWRGTLGALLAAEHRDAAGVSAAGESAASRTWEATAEALASQYTRLVEERA